MSSTGGDFDRQRIVVADEDLAVAAFVAETLSEEGHAVFHTLAGLSAVQLAVALDSCHLLISDTQAEQLRSIAKALLRTSEPLQ